MENTKIDMEVDRMDEETDSKSAVGEQPIGGSSPPASATRGRKRKKQNTKATSDLNAESKESIDDPVKVKQVKPKKVYKYRLNYRRDNGVIRPDISSSIIYMINLNWADLIRVIPSDRWVTMDEIVKLVFEWENTYPRKTTFRTRNDIEEGIDFLLDVGVLLRDG